MDCKEKVKQKKSVGKDENVKRQRSFGKEDFYENEVKRQGNSGKAELCEDGVKRQQEADKVAAGRHQVESYGRSGRQYSTSNRHPTGSARKENDNHNARRQRNGRGRRPSDGRK